MHIVPATPKHIRRVERLLERQERHDTTHRWFRTKGAAIRAFLIEEDPDKGLCCTECGDSGHLEDACHAQPCPDCGEKSCFASECLDWRRDLKDFIETMDYALRVMNRRHEVRGFEDDLEHYHDLFEHPDPVGQCSICVYTALALRDSAA